MLSTIITLNPFVNGQAIANYSFAVAFVNLSFNQPVGLIADPTNANRLFVIEQPGIIRVFNNSKGSSTSSIFLNVTDQVLYGGEQGLLGLAFDPNFGRNGYFYVNYVADNPRRTVIARYSVSLDPNVADSNSAEIILEIRQPYSNHKGGQLAFGADGFLYIAVGDGGSEGDPMGNGQNRSTLLGKILRINVDLTSSNKNYSIPSNNPFVGNTAGILPEIYAYGLRNPWRFSFDDATGKLWVGDVGGSQLEEIDLVEKGKNYGWNIMEGTVCFNPANGCNQTGLEVPIWNYTHTVGNAIIGGYVYHGSALPSLDGAYIYGDYGSGRVWELRYDGTSALNSQLVNSGLDISSFGIDTQNELYFTSLDGKIYQLTVVAISEYPAITWLVFLLTVLTMLFIPLRIWNRQKQ
jgi:glucose/arabinose dehydrogenase